MVPKLTESPIESEAISDTDAAVGVPFATWGVYVSVVVTIVSWAGVSASSPSKDSASTKPIESAQPVPHDDLSLLEQKYGAPDIDDSTEHDNPRPPIVSRLITYKKEHVRAAYIPDAQEGADPPYANWKFIGFQDPRNNEVLSAAEATKRLKNRAKMPIATASAGPTAKDSTTDVGSYILAVFFILVVVGLPCLVLFGLFRLITRSSRRKKAALVAPRSSRTSADDPYGAGAAITMAISPSPASEAVAPPEPPTLSALTKLQFRKYVSEQSGMGLSEVDTYLAGLQDRERQELQRSFQAVQLSSSSAATSVPMAAPVPTAPNPNQPECPKCGSSQTTYDRQKFGVGKAAAGVILTGGIGLLAGGIGRNKIIITCMNCGHHWKVG